MITRQDSDTRQWIDTMYYILMDDAYFTLGINVSNRDLLEQFVEKEYLANAIGFASRD